MIFMISYYNLIHGAIKIYFREVENLTRKTFAFLTIFPVNMLVINSTLILGALFFFLGRDLGAQ